MLRARPQRHRASAVAALIAAAVVAVALVGGCSSGNSTADTAAQQKSIAAQDKQDHALDVQYNKLVAQDKAVEAANRVAVNHQRLVNAIRRVWNERGWNYTGTARRIVQGPTVTQTIAIARVAVCGRAGGRGGSKAQRLARRAVEARRRQALYYLNLSCPAA